VSTSKLNGNLLLPTSRHINYSQHTEQQDHEYRPQRRLSSSSSIVQGKSTGLLSCSTSSLVGDMILTPDDVIKLKENLRKTGLTDGKQTLRKQYVKETVQVDFRSVLRSSADARTSNITTTWKN
jgi:hypothetical protein